MFANFRKNRVETKRIADLLKTVNDEAHRGADYWVKWEIEKTVRKIIEDVIKEKITEALIVPKTSEVLTVLFEQIAKELLETYSGNAFAEQMKSTIEYKVASQVKNLLKDERY